MTRQLNGWHIVGIFCLFFGTIMAVNFTMASYASSTFGGVVVENSYVASQKFNGWLEGAEQSRALGWTVTPARHADGRLVLTTAGVPAGAEIVAVARHPLGHQPDQVLTFAQSGEARYSSREDLPAGRWLLRLTVRSGATEWKGESEIR